MEPLHASQPGHQMPQLPTVSRYLREKLNETIFTTRRQPGIGKLFNNVKGKIGKQSIQKRSKFMDAQCTGWLGMEMDDSVKRHLLKQTSFSYQS